MPREPARAGRRLRRELLDAGRRLRQPRPLRAAGDRARRQPGHDPRRGLVPPGPRRHDHQHRRARRPQRPDRVATSDHYAELRGRRFRGPERRHALRRQPAGRRRCARRRGGWAPPSTSSWPTSSAPTARPAQADRRCPEELRTEFVDAFWRSLEWQETTWLGRRMAQAADRPLRLPGADRPRCGPTGSSRPAPAAAAARFFLASICELLGHGQVLSIDDTEVPRLAEHHADHLPARGPVRRPPRPPPPARSSATNPRGLVILGASKLDNLMQRVRELLASSSRWTATWCSRTRSSTGTRSGPGSAPGPHEAAKRITDRGRLRRDAPSIERFAFSFNRGGFLRRFDEALQPRACRPTTRSSRNASTLPSPDRGRPRRLFSAGPRTTSGSGSTLRAIAAPPGCVSFSPGSPARRSRNTGPTALETTPSPTGSISTVRFRSSISDMEVATVEVAAFSTSAAASAACFASSCGTWITGICMAPTTTPISSSSAARATGGVASNATGRSRLPPSTMGSSR